jgi:uncharacterized membrane protein
MNKSYTNIKILVMLVVAYLKKSNMNKSYTNIKILVMLVVAYLNTGDACCGISEKK